MPKVTLSLRRLESFLATRPGRAELETLLFASKAQLEGGEGDELLIEGTADRLDLLTEGGLGLYLQGATDAARGVPKGLSGSPFARLTIEVSDAVAPLRPEIAGVVVEPPPGTSLDQPLLDEAIRFQELLHTTLGRDRRSASLGIYPLERLTGPIRYDLEPVSSVRFVPLDAATEVDGPSFFRDHPMAAHYGAYGRAGDRCLTLRDARAQLLSLPPVLNARPAGEARAGDGPLLIESTGTKGPRVVDCVALLALVFLARGWRAAPVAVSRGPAGATRAVLPSTSVRHLSSATLRRLAGAELPVAEVTEWLERARFDAHAVPGGWQVTVPPWRPDVQAEVDLAEDVLLARGVRPEDGILPASPTRGRRSPESTFRARMASRLLGLGLVPLYSPVLVSESLVSLCGHAGAVAIENPVSEQYARLRDSLLLPLLAALEANPRHGYPQRFSEVGPVIRRSEDARRAPETRYHAGIVLAHEGAGFADAAALVDYLVRSCGAAGVREPREVPGTIPGRSAGVRLAGELVGEAGEVHPSVLRALKVPVPVAWAEVDLTALQTLGGRLR